MVSAMNALHTYIEISSLDCVPVSSRDHNSSNGGVGGEGVKVTKSTFGGNASEL